MSNELLEATQEIIDQLGVPITNSITPAAQERYMEGLDLMLTYRGDPEVLWDALQVFESTGSRAYICAGIALTLNHAAYIQGDKYDKHGLQ